MRVRGLDYGSDQSVHQEDRCGNGASRHLKSTVVLKADGLSVLTAGDTRTPSMINFFCYRCFRIPLAWVLAVTLHWGPRGVFAALPSAETAMTIASLILFRRGVEKEDD
jgi:hypothetical protein